MIVSFACRDTERFYHAGTRPKWLPPTVVAVAHRKLDMVEVARKLTDLRSPPGNRLEALKGKLKGFHSIRINDQWRVVLRWHESGAHDVRVIDYH